MHLIFLQVLMITTIRDEHMTLVPLDVGYEDLEINHVLPTTSPTYFLPNLNMP